MYFTCAMKVYIIITINNIYVMKLCVRKTSTKILN